MLVNQREYPGSSGFYPEELSHLHGNDYDAQLAVLKGFGLELAVFLSRFIEFHDIPRPAIRDGRRTGGMAILAWSLGNMTLFSFLAYGHEYRTEVREVVEQYVHTAIVYGE